MATSPTFDVVVVGAGPAGLAGARRAAESGASVALIDDNPSAGGQIWRGPAPEVAQWKAAAGKPIRIMTGARVFASPAPHCLALETLDGEIEVTCRSLILATGARERFIPFPGWTLPNVAGAGGLQALVKSGLPITGKNVVIAGSGPLLLAVAKYMHEHGAIIRCIAEQAGQSALFRFGIGLALHPGKLFQAVQLRAQLLGIPYLTGCWPVSAQGSGKIESVTLRQADRTWNEPCDYLACGFGLIPNVELAAMLGCLIGETGVQVDNYQQTSVEDVYAAGEATGIGGLELSLVEGEIAGFAAAGKHEQASRRFRARQSHRHFAAALEKTFSLRDDLKQVTHDDTLVCRCEDVPWKRIRACSGWREAKLHTRCGMGPCQGRVCGGALEFLLDWKPESVRPPLFPARIGSLTRSAGIANQGLRP